MADVGSRLTGGDSVLVTGAYGLLGSWLTAELLRRGAAVTVLRRDITPCSELVLGGAEARCNVVSGDVCDPGLVARTLAEYEVDTVYHLAAQTIVATAGRSPLGTWETNIRGTWTLLEACRGHGARRVIVAASDKAYGAHDELPYREHQALRPKHPYEVSKAAADMIARSYWDSFGLPVAVTRLANIYGGGDLNRSRLVPEAVAAALGGRAPVIRSDGTPERDYLYVEDAVAAYLAVASTLDSGAGCGQAFNAGTGIARPVLEIVRGVCRAAGVDVEPEIRGAGTPPGEIDRQFVDSAKLRALTGWRPAVELDDGLARTVAWYRERPAALIGAGREARSG